MIRPAKGSRGPRIKPDKDNKRLRAALGQHTNGPKTLRDSALNKMPNDCTDRPNGRVLMNSLCPLTRIQYIMDKMQLKQRKSKKTGPKQVIKDLLPPGVKLTKEGMDWMVLATDPFHDLKREVAGYPDSDSINSVVRCIQANVDLVAPGGANWDCHIFTLPITQTQALAYGTNVNGKFVAAGAVNNLNIGMVNVFSGAVGSQLFAVNGTAPTYTFPTVATTEASQYQSRVIGLGLEVINTTAEVYRQGVVTCYRSPNRADVGSLYYDDEKVIDAVKEQRGTYPSLNISPPPSSVADALLLKGTQQWEAKEGAYMAVALNSVDNPFRKEKYTGVEMTTLTNMPLAGVTVPHNDDVTGIPYPKYQKECSITTSGMFFTGLSPQTTLTLRVKLYLEIAPTANTATQKELANLANPSAPYDPEALVYYSRLMQTLPIATESKRNANGDWFKAVLKQLRKIVRPGMKLLDKALPGTSAGFDNANNWLDKWIINPAARAFPQIP